MNSGLLAQLYDHQTAVHAAMAETQALLANMPADPEAVNAARGALGRLLTGYQIFKHQQIFLPLAGSSNRTEAETARQLKIECIAMGEKFRTYLSRWTARGIEGREAECRGDARGMVAMLTRHIQRERGAIEALLAPELRAA